MQKNCKKCWINFEITKNDLDFYDKISPVFNGIKYQIPSPTLCPNCRQQRRLSFINVQNLYKRKDKTTGKDLISPFSPDKDLNIVSRERWFSDEIDAKEYGRDFDFSKSFFEQYLELGKVAPRWSNIVHNCENCDWNFNIADSKNCYFVRSSLDSERCLYSLDLRSAYDTVDSLLVSNSELCYEVINGQNCFRILWSENVKNCQDSMLLFDCENVKNSIACTSLRHKENYFLNEKVTKKEIEDIWGKILNNENFKNKISEDFEKLKLKSFHRANTIINSANCTGDEIFNSKNIHESFSVINCEDGKYLFIAYNTKDAYDCSKPDMSELTYETSSCHKLYNCHFCFNSIDLLNCYYCETTSNLKNCFGCVGLKNSQYCILNKQYTKEEYEELVSKIIGHMRTPSNSSLTTGEPEWAEFFPSSMSPFGYNETIANEYFPLTKKNIEMHNCISLQKLNWSDYKSPVPNVEKIVSSEKLPYKISDIPNDILNWAIRCEKTKRPYIIQLQELEFYRKMHLPIPHYHPDIRYEKRMIKRNSIKLWERNCQECNTIVQTKYTPNRPEMILCESCYLKKNY